MRLLFLSEGDPETHDSWSGVSKSVVTHLRGLGHTVLTGDVEPYGLSKLAVAARTFAPSRRRWWVRYHLGDEGYEARSTIAADLVRRHGSQVDAILQVGATFETPLGAGLPLALYCDSNIQLSRAGSTTGHSEAAMLTDAECERIRVREDGVYRRADLIFTMSDMLRRSFMEDFRLPAERLVTVHCAPNTPFPELRPPEASERPPTALFVGRDFGRKGGGVLLEAMARVRAHIPEARALFVGTAPPAEPPAWADFVGFQSRDTQAGRDAMDLLYRSADVFCLPTRFEPFGTSFVEAMGYGLPCVGPRAWAVPEIIEDGRTGFLVPPEDTDSFANALLELLRDPELCRRMGHAGRARAQALFTWPRIAERMVEALEPMVRA